MKALFLWNTAGALTPVVNLLNRSGHIARVIAPNDGFNSKAGTIPEAKFVNGASDFYPYLVATAIKYRPNIVHISSIPKFLVLVRVLMPRAKTVFEWHGTDIRGKPRNIWVDCLADKVIVATRDLMQYGEYLAPPMDGITYYRGGRVQRTALMIVDPSFPDMTEKALSFCEDRGLYLTLHNRRRVTIPHSLMPEYLSKFEYYLDLKGLTTIGTISLTATEAILCGCKVLTDDGHILTECETAKPEEYIELYHSLLGVEN